MNNREILLQYAQKQAPVYQQLALDIHAHPEVSNYEFYACEHLSRQLAAEGFDVKVDVAGHSEAFKAASCSQKGLDAVVIGAQAMALTALDLIEQPELLAAIQKEHRQNVAAQEA